MCSASLHQASIELQLSKELLLLGIPVSVVEGLSSFVIAFVPTAAKHVCKGLDPMLCRT